MQIKENQIPKIKGRIVVRQSMKNLTSLKIGGVADFFAVPEDLEDLKLILSFCKREKIPFFVIGNGSKLLVADEGFPGVVIKLGGSFRKIENHKEEIKVGAGADLSTLIDFTAQKGLSGLESLSGIPGTVGGAIARNASAFGRSLSQKVLSAKILDEDDGCLILSNKDMNFGYRSSTFLTHHKDWVIVEVNLSLSPGKKGDIFSRLRETRKRKILTQPISFPSAGCVFKNPSSYPAGYLVQQAGCPGLRIGDAQVSHQHANFIINKGKATAQDVLGLIEEVKKRVQDRFGILLEPELEII
ncbi:MAG: UDP-N-acetylmuramate dehydrogenase [bacterium]